MKLKKMQVDKNLMSRSEFTQKHFRETIKLIGEMMNSGNITVEISPALNELYEAAKIIEAAKRVFNLTEWPHAVPTEETDKVKA